MTEAEILHKRKMQLKNEVVKPLLTLIDKGLTSPAYCKTLPGKSKRGMALTVKSGDGVGTNKVNNPGNKKGLAA
jgi:hypothetical protein